MDYEETELDEFNTFDDSVLDVHIWGLEDPKAILLCIHGAMAHAGDYVNIGSFFKDKGYTTISYDLRGHKRKRVKITSFDDIVQDTSFFINWAKNKFSALPIFLVGHSAGCNILTKYLIEKENEENEIKGVIFSSPYFSNLVKVPGIMKTLSGVLAAIMPNAKLPAEDFTPYLTHDTRIYDRHRADEKKNIRASEPSIRFGSELLKSQKWISNNFEKFDHDLLVFVAGDDKLTDVQISRELFKKLNQDRVTIIDYPENYHENFNENNRNITFDTMFEWMEKRLI